MRNEATIRGTVYTREEIEAGMAQLNFPRGGDVVTYSGSAKRYLVLDPESWLVTALKKEFGAEQEAVVRVIDGHFTYALPASRLTVVGTLHTL